jgi:hypothetical protein
MLPFMGYGAGLRHYPKLSLSGALTTSSGSSPVTSSTRTITGAGTLLFVNIATDGGSPQYSLNGGSFTNITEGLTLAVADTDTIAVRATLATTSDQASVDLYDNLYGQTAEGLVEGVVLTKT